MASDITQSLYGQPVVLSLEDQDLPDTNDILDVLPRAVSRALSACMRVGLLKKDHTFCFNIPGVSPRHPITIRGVPSSSVPNVAVPHARARAIQLKGLTEREKLAELAQFDEMRPAARGQKIPFYRQTQRLHDLVERATGMTNPSARIADFQLPTAFSFGGGPPPPERPLFAPVLGAIDVAAKSVSRPDYHGRLDRAANMGDYTTHDPDTLHPRFLNYVRERVEFVDQGTNAALDHAVSTLHHIWRNHHVHAAPRSLSDATPEKLSDIVNHGSPGEYRKYGVQDRKDPRLMVVMSQSLVRYGHVGRLAHAGKRIPGWVHSTIQPTLTFGKDEPKAAKMEDGLRVAPVPRFIFNLSPINYALATFLHYDLSHELQEKSPLHGPGFGPARGRDGKFRNVIENCFKGGFELTDGTEMVMSDIEKWDASITEVLLGKGYDCLESFIDVKKLDGVALATRKIMSGVARRQLLHKVVEHPSGYLLDLYGTMPSGSFFTSEINTEDNNIVTLAFAIEEISQQTEYTMPHAAEILATLAPGLMVSYGDNQLFNTRIFTHFGIEYNPQRHAAFLARFGMKLKVDETEITTKLGKVRFCSRAIVQTPHGLAITRTHTSLAAKLAARPEHDPLVDKLYVRALMADTLGTDPILYGMMSQIDRQIADDLDVTVITPRIRPVIESAAQTLLGDKSPSALNAVLLGLRGSSVDRRALLSLQTPITAGTRRERSLGTSLTVGGNLFGGPLTRTAEWLSRQTPQTWDAYLMETGQTDVYFDKE
nr:RNA dependent RNA polymerase [Trichoderma barbatum polymycovirus 1]